MSTQREAVQFSMSVDTEFLEDLQHWSQVDRLTASSTNRRAARRLLDLIKAVLRYPFSGVHYPEEAVWVHGRT